MSVDRKDLEDVLVGGRERWSDGPPLDLFKRLRRQCPVHWSKRITADVHDVSRDWSTYSSERGGFTALTHAILPLELQRAMFIGMDPPKHDRLKALFQRGFTPKRIAGVALARLELRVLFEETLARFPRMELDGDPEYAVSPFANQLKRLPVRLRA